MEGDSKKWILDMSPPPNDTEASEVTHYLVSLENLPADTIDSPLFINSDTWLPMTANDFIGSPIKPNAAFSLNKIVIFFASNLERLSKLSTSSEASEIEPLMTHALFSIAKHISESTELPTGSTKGTSSLEMMDSALSALFRLHSSLTEDLCMTCITLLHLIIEAMGNLPAGVYETWQNRILNSNLRNFLYSRSTAKVSASMLEVELKLFLHLRTNRPISNKDSSIFWNVVAARISKAESSEPFLAVLTQLGEVSPEHFMQGPLALRILADAILKSEQGGEKNGLFLDAKSYDFETMIPECASQILGNNEKEIGSTVRVLSFWRTLGIDYEHRALILDEMTLAAKKKKAILSKHPVASQTISTVFSSFSIEEQFRYLLSWLLKFEEMSSLDRILTKIETIEEAKPIVDLLEVGFNILHLITPKKLIERNRDREDVDEAEKEGEKSEQKENSSIVDVKVYHDLISLMIMRMDVPDYFFYLRDTKLYDEANYGLGEFRVKTFQHLTGHFWYLLDSILSYMPPMELLNADNPILILPEGVKAPIEVPIWFDALLVMFALHGMHSDFSTKESLKDVNDSILTLTHCEAVKELGKNVFSLRLRQCIKFVKTKRSQVIDEANKFSIIMWLCAHVPIAQLKPEQDGLDSEIFKALVSAIEEVLRDYRTNIKILGLDLVALITGMLQHSANDAKNSVDSENRPIPALPHLPRSIFDAIVKSLNFRELYLVELALKTSIAMIKLREKEELVRLDWASALMQAMAYEMDYVQKQDLLLAYLARLPDVLPFLGLSLISFSHPLLVRLVSLLDIGTFKMTIMSLDSIEAVMRLSWPRAHVEAEMVFGAVATVWIDQVWILPSETSITETVKKNIEYLKEKIKRCLIVIFAILEPARSKKMIAEVESVEELKPFHELCSELFKPRIAQL